MEYIENEYFDSDGKQLKPFPDKWMSAKKRFKPGQVIICKDLKHQGGSREHPTRGLNVECEIVEVKDGYGYLPPWLDRDGETWHGQHSGYLVVKVPWVVYASTRVSYCARFGR